MNAALLIHVAGIVQGVGFRPFVFRQAKHYLISGWVLNATDGVTIHAEGDEKLVDQFVLALANDAPAAAQVEEITMKEVPLEGFTTFEIRFSDDADVERTTLVSPDLATCADCVRELFDPSDRRYRYPFINCTNCGPRFTIIESLPYDRAATSMRGFAMCPTCAAEYADPADRRFHAQPDACFECGPHLSLSQREGGEWETRWGTTREESDAIVAMAVAALLEGKIVAVKGLGGFHLACDALNAQAVATLRERKHRDGKAFAVMMPDVEAVRRFCSVSDEEAALLTGAQRPIVLLRLKAHDAMRDEDVGRGSLADSFAGSCSTTLHDAASAAFEAAFDALVGGLAELGVMLPYTPVQHLLMHDFAQAGGTMLVMTSGNVHDEPIVTDDAEALEKLGDIADLIIGNNRPILSRYDDSVVRVLDLGADGGGTAVQMIRRARGYTPVPLALSHEHGSDQAIYAVGPEQKNTLCVTRPTEDGGAEAFVSQHIGDLENAETFDAWLDAKDRYETLFRTEPTLLAYDLHPEYLATKWVSEQPLPSFGVQHHHAHLASVLGEHALTGPAIGFAFDGTGYGPDGAIWGGEVLLADAASFERFANFAYAPMPGGAAAVKEPLRMTYGMLWAYDLLEHPAAQRALEGFDRHDILQKMIDQAINTPMTSSVGRLFDAVAALLGICQHPSYEGEPAMLLEAVLWRSGVADDEVARAEAIEQAQTRYAPEIVKNTATAASTAQDTSIVLIDAASTLKAVLDDVQEGVVVPIIALRFHEAIIESVLQVAAIARALYDIWDVALAGGVFMNRYLIQQLPSRLAQAGFRVAINRDLPPNDGAVSFGQAVVAYNSLTRNMESGETD